MSVRWDEVAKNAERHERNDLQSDVRRAPCEWSEGGSMGTRRGTMSVGATPVEVWQTKKSFTLIAAS